MDTVVYSKTFTFKKIAYYGTRKINTPEVKITLTNKEGKYCLAISGKIWNSKHTDILCGGQCLDFMNKFDSLHIDPIFKQLYKFWKLYHLNDLHAGTEKQEKLLSERKGKYSYEENRKYLESKGLLFDNGYEYGSAWLYREIPEQELETIKELVCCQD